MRKIIPLVLMLCLAGCAQADIDRNLASLKSAFTPQRTDKSAETPIGSWPRVIPAIIPGFTVSCVVGRAQTVVASRRDSENHQ